MFKWLATLCAVAAAACSVSQAMHDASQSIVSTTVNEINREIEHAGSKRRAQQDAQPPQQAPAPRAPAPQQAPVQVASAQQPAPSNGNGHRTSALFAVLDFKNRIKGKDAESVDSVYFANLVRSAVKRAAPQARVMTRENVIVLLESQGKKLDECEGECEVDTGRRLGADMVVSGDLLKIGTTWKLDLRMHQTSDGSLISGAAASGKSPDDLDQDAQRAVTELLSPLQ